LVPNEDLDLSDPVRTKWADNACEPGAFQPVEGLWNCVSSDPCPLCQIEDPSSERSGPKLGDMAQNLEQPTLVGIQPMVAADVED
jgi:hypothetical protein